MDEFMGAGRYTKVRIGMWLDLSWEILKVHRQLFARCAQVTAYDLA